MTADRRRSRRGAVCAGPARGLHPATGAAARRGPASRGPALPVLRRGVHGAGRGAGARRPRRDHRRPRLPDADPGPIANAERAVIDAGSPGDGRLLRRPPPRAGHRLQHGRPRHVVHGVAARGSVLSAAIVMAGRSRQPARLDRLATRPTYVIHSRDDEVVEFEPTENTAVKELQRLGRTIELEAARWRRALRHEHVRRPAQPRRRVDRRAVEDRCEASTEAWSLSREPSHARLSFLRDLEERIRRVRAVCAAADQRHLALARDAGDRARRPGARSRSR